ncbi:hypothetical protein [Bdellovibrio sp. NC01]|uniref:hypothetical protein n=1 Tax=Bdellovibrio sp. NC01 TaxID=2220073 RepID=UPI0011597F11|nr:hypothetical protein [Bdellovibrio sp. NC01]QDK38507.1 hypothetical protein DOE51_13430 [Bdellovibrio sp. NC01]
MIKNNRGQVIIEWVLLMVISLGLAAILTKNLVSRDRDDGGVLTTKWNAVLRTVGADIPDKHN